MKRLFPMTVIILVLASFVMATTMTYDAANYLKNRRTALSGAASDPIYRFMVEAEGLIESGAVSSDGNTITFGNGGTISNATDGAIILADASEDLKLAFTSNTGTLSSSTSLATLDFGTIAPTFGALITGTAGQTITGAAVSLNASSNFAVNIGTGTNNSLVSIGGGSGTVAINGNVWGVTSAGALNSLKKVVTTTTTPVAVSAANSGSVYVSYGVAAGAADCVFTLPTAAAGLTYTFVDANSTAGDDLWITAAAGDTINGGTAAKSYKCTGDAVKQHVTIVAIDATRWEIIAEDGTWANDNN